MQCYREQSGHVPKVEGKGVGLEDMGKKHVRFEGKCKSQKRWRTQLLSLNNIGWRRKNEVIMVTGGCKSKCLPTAWNILRQHRKNLFHKELNHHVPES